jgi:hypothetical protein
MRVLPKHFQATSGSAGVSAPQLSWTTGEGFVGLMRT